MHDWSTLLMSLTMLCFSTVNNQVLPEFGPGFTVYGWSVLKQDLHTLHSLRGSGFQRAAYRSK